MRQVTDVSHARVRGQRYNWGSPNPLQVQRKCFMKVSAAKMRGRQLTHVCPRVGHRVGHHGDGLEPKPAKLRFWEGDTSTHNDAALE